MKRVRRVPIDAIVGEIADGEAEEEFDAFQFVGGVLSPAKDALADHEMQELYDALVHQHPLPSTTVSIVIAIAITSISAHQEHRREEEREGTGTWRSFFLPLS
jgi:hypothetical protein